jgi:hypothetical protein
MIYYRINVTDTYGTTTSGSTIVRFFNVIWYGPTESTPNSSSAVRGLGTKVFTDHTNPFSLETGTTQKNFAIAVPATISVTNVTDLDALNANITDSYVSSNVTVDNAGGQPTSYKVYVMSNAIPYSENHRHQVTRA